MNKSLYIFLSFLLVSFIVSCSDDSVSSDDLDFDIGSEIETLGPIQKADDVVFDVDWASGTIIAEESDVLSDVQDLDVPDGVYRIAADSPLLDGLRVGDIVVWPQLGIFNILDIQDQGGVVAVTTEWARFSDAMEEADIQFRHDLTAGSMGRAIGITPIDPSSGKVLPDEQFDILAGSTTFKITENGFDFSTGSDGYNFKMSANTGGVVNLDLTSSVGPVEASLKGVLSGLTADGAIQLTRDAEDPDPAVGIFFNNVQMDVTSSLKVSGSRGSDSINPNALLVFPFTIGPIPAFAAVTVRYQVRSSISRANATLEATAGFSAVADVAVGRNPDGAFAAQGEVRNFSTDGPELSFEASNTSGIGFDFDAPRITFGIGRPGIGTMAVFGTTSAELVFNVTFNTDAEWCMESSLGAAINVGGEISFLRWSRDRPVTIANYSGPSGTRGSGCPSGNILLIEPTYEDIPYQIARPTI
ncbi:MAG: hypothetical protein JJU37_01090 [Balneolaceae bacterium]|nr:hypothetical protein [Balneolaceae bacterium]